jgi:hypothetical protein
MSGKAMQSTVPPAGTARVVTRRIEESEGHVAEFAASLLPLTDALAAPKLEPAVLAITFSHKQMTSKDLVGERTWVRRATAEITRNPKCRTMHIPCTLLPNTRKHQAHGGFWPAMGLDEMEVSED